MHITDWLEMLGEHFPLVVIGCAEALLAVVLLCAALRNRRQCADKNGAHSGGQMRFCYTTWIDRAMTYALSCVSTTCCRSVRQEICREPSRASMEETANAFRSRRILLAEDNEINAMIMVEVLQEMGAEIETAENGQIAVDKFSEHPENCYDFILMDVQMPVMDGGTAARTIRAMKRPDAKSILIFALSADAFVEDERLSIESGMNGHYAKPVVFRALQRNIGKFLQRRERVS